MRDLPRWSRAPIFDDNMFRTRRIAATPSHSLIGANLGLVWATMNRLLNGFLAMLALLAAVAIIAPGPSCQKNKGRLE